MSNSTGSITTSFVDTLTGTFFTWFNSDILPVCAATVDTLVIIVGFVLNVLLIVTFRKRGLFLEPSSHFLLMMCLVDFMSYVLLLIPNIITSIVKEWILTDPVCKIHGGISFYLVFCSFAFSSVLCVERTVKLCCPDGEKYEKIFNNKRTRSLVIGAIWVVAGIVGFLPATGIGNIHYDFYHQGCWLNYTTSPVFLIVHFVLTCVFPTITVIVCYSLIFKSKHKALLENRKSGSKSGDKGRGRNTTTSSIGGQPLPSISEADDNDVFDGNGTGKKTAFADEKPGQSKTGDTNKKGRPKSPPKQSMLFEVFSDDEENPAFHLSLTYLYVWAILFICYFPYIVICFYGTFDDGPLWGGFYTVTMLVVHVSFAIKPIIYLGHNRHYQAVTKQTIPEGVRNRANSVRNSVYNFADTVQDFVFKSNTNKKFNAALTTQKAVLVWKKKLKKRRGMVPLKNELEEEKTTPAGSNSLVNKIDSPSTMSTATNVKNSGYNAVNYSNHSNNIAGAKNRVAVTPSEIQFAPTPSTFIEKERQRIKDMSNSGEPSGATNLVMRHSPNSTSPLPGMIDDPERQLLYA